MELGRSIIRSVCVIIGFVLHISASIDVRLPPSIVEQPLVSEIFTEGSELTLTCVASGYPSPVYKWTKNGQRLGHARNIVSLSDGSIRIENLSSQDEGYYQCQAKNEFGVAVSRVATLNMAVLRPTGATTTTVFESPPIKVGEPYTLKCNRTRSFPRATVSWVLASTAQDENPKGLITDKRVQVDDEGSLHFAHVLESDAAIGLYKCNMYNPYLNFIVGGSYSKLNIVPASGKIPFFKPNALFSSGPSVVALEGQKVTLRCFFSGYSVPSLRWSKVNGSMPYGRYNSSHSESEINIYAVKQSDEGEYKCTGQNEISESIVIKVDVQAVPVFKRLEDKPQNMNVTEGDSITIKCDAYAEPGAKVTWMRNGVKLDPDNLPHKYRLSNDNKHLHISNICKTCPDGSSDLAVIQCNASNVHGYAFGEGYINVLKMTEIVESPETVNVSINDTSKSVTFNCRAISDDSTPVEIIWYHVRNQTDSRNEKKEKPQEGSGDQLLMNNSDVFTIEKTEIVERPEDVYLSADDSSLSVTFNCRATSDDSTPVQIRWYRVHNEKSFGGAGDERLHNFTNIVSIDSDGTKLKIKLDQIRHDLHRYSGDYKCAANNGYSTVEAIASLFIDRTSGQTATELPIRPPIITEYWLIFLLAAIILLLFIILVCYCIFLSRNKGDTYMVDKKEKQGGLDTMKDLEAERFQDYKRPDDSLAPGSHVSLNSSINMNSDDEGSLNQYYGDVDVGKFTEDGSFIGNYNGPNIPNGHH